jgi:hypothetical protein
LYELLRPEGQTIALTEYCNAILRSFDEWKPQPPMQLTAAHVYLTLDLLLKAHMHEAAVEFVYACHEKGCNWGLSSSLSATSPPPPSPPQQRQGDAASHAVVALVPNLVLTTSTATQDPAAAVEGAFATAIPAVDRSPELETILGLTLPRRLPPRVIIRVLQCHMHIADAQPYVQPMLKVFFDFPVQEHYTLYSEVIDTCMEAKCYKEAVQVITQVSMDTAFDRPFLWLRRAQCLYKMNYVD